jgi:DNA-binding HxlR family transcriptional regulator
MLALVRGNRPGLTNKSSLPSIRPNRAYVKGRTGHYMQDTHDDRIIVDKGAVMNSSRETIPVPISYINNHSLSNGASLFLLRLLARGGHFYASLREIAPEFNIHSSILDRHIEELEEAGIVKHTLIRDENAPVGHRHWRSNVQIVGMEAEA